MKKNLYFESGKLIPGNIGAALSGQGQKIDLITLCKKVNENDICYKFPKMKFKLELVLKNKQLDFKIVALTRELLLFFAKDNKITNNCLDEIVKIKISDFNTSNIDSIKKTILAYAKTIKIELTE